MARHPDGQITITFMSGPLDGKTLEWDYPEDETEMALTIGRRENCDIYLDYDTQVSRLHARVIYVPETQTFFLEDAGSKNGTFLDGDQLTGRKILKPGTLFRVGRTWLRIDPYYLPTDDTGPTNL